MTQDMHERQLTSDRLIDLLQPEYSLIWEFPKKTLFSFDLHDSPPYYFNWWKLHHQTIRLNQLFAAVIVSISCLAIQNRTDSAKRIVAGRIAK
jgi:hypothetical protein